ncbi:hypothetical protein NESM_000659300 [Novymonas esmeraldas]|uniref:TsaA-like domain-containing protein n=1 Tax=Novymonas esmeraldas TaxID=1808958 RepID=A0AAW0EVH5_9TRYP
MSVSASSPSQAPREDTATRKRHRVRSNYFLVGDLVWVRPAKLPYWPAEVLESDEATNRVRARLLAPPPLPVLAANVAEERRRREQQRKRQAARCAKLEKDEPHHTPTGDGTAADVSAAGAAVDVQAEPEPDVVTASGTDVYFFDKLRTTAELDACLEDRLQRAKHDVAAYEANFTQAVLQANRRVRIPLSAGKLLPYEVCAVGIVHSLMREHIAAPRQPNTGTFEPQTALIRLRAGLENAARDLAGFEFIWVLFQFSFAAPMASGEGQESLRTLLGASATSETEGGEAHSDPVALATSQLDVFRQRQGFDKAAGFKTMIVPPRDEELRGVFATRSPHRPNFIGLSCVRLVAVRGLDIHVADHDLLHGTPVLDIKPYLPFCDAHPDARAGWVEALDASGRGKGDHKYDKQAHLVHRVGPK